MLEDLRRGAAAWACGGWVVVVMVVVEAVRFYVCVCVCVEEEGGARLRVGNARP